MLKRLYIDNFKGLNNFTLDFTPLTVLIGENGAGKSTVLLALHIVKLFTDNELYKINAQNFMSKILKQSIIHFKLTFKIDEKDVVWSLQFAEDNNKLALIEEKITSNRTLALKNNNEQIIFNEQTGKEQKNSFPMVELISILNIFTTKEKLFIEKYSTLYKIWEIVSQLHFFNTLNPKLISSDSLYYNKKMSQDGRNFPSFFHNLKEEQKKEITSFLRNELLPSIFKIDTQLSQYDKVELSVSEKFDGKDFTLHASCLSEGFLRMLVLISIIHIEGNNSILLLDEIENGINPHLAGKIVNYFIRAIKDTNKQIILTTHSHSFVNYLDEKNIVFMWKDSSGKVFAKRIFDEERMKEYIDFMNPGDAWVNLDRDILIGNQQ